jgi:cbb3-type cytochrome oxidase subunit 3
LESFFITYEKWLCMIIFLSSWFVTHLLLCFSLCMIFVFDELTRMW